jgi:pilus assembly protein Flp/PilA
MCSRTQQPTSPPRNFCASGVEKKASRPLKIESRFSAARILDIFGFLRSRGKIPARSENMTSILKRLWREEQGQDLTEYALLIVLVALVAIASMTTLGASISDVFVNATANLTTT